MTRVCAICGATFEGKTRAKYCSDSCKKTAHKEQMKAINERAKQVRKKALNNPINVMINECIRKEYSKRESEMFNIFNESKIEFIAITLNINLPNVKSVKDGICDLNTYRKIINKLDQIISLY